MRAVVLVGGFGTRLRPLTFAMPKQMLPIAGRPMIEEVLAHLAKHGIDDAVLSLGYRPDAFRDTYPDGVCAGVQLHYAVEPEPLDTAGAIRFAALDAGIDERFLVVNGDVLTDLDVTGLVAFHDDAGAEATIALHQVEDPSRYGVVPTDNDGRVVAFVEKPPRDEAPSDRINAGTYVLERSVVDRIPGGRRVSIERETFPAMAADGTLFARDDDGVYWLDAGTPAAYLQAQLDLLSGVRGEPVAGVAADASVAATATVCCSIVGAGVTIGDGAEVVDSVVLAGATVDAGAVVRRSIVGGGSRVGTGAVLDDLTVVGFGVEIEAGARLSGATVPEATG